MSVFLSFLPAWVDLVFYIYWGVLIVMLIMDDREPSITLAWLFILLFLPLIGVIFYIFFGRDWKVVARRKGWVKRLRDTEVAEMAPIYERNVQAVARFYEEWGDSIAEPISRAISKENVAQGPAGVVARALQRRRAQVPPPQGGPRRGAALHPPAVLHLGAGPAHGRAGADPPRPPPGGRRGPHHVRLDGLHLVPQG